MTRRGRMVVLTAALVASLAAGMTAQLWNPYSRALDRCSVQRFEDGSSVTSCAGGVVSVAHVDR